MSGILSRWPVVVALPVTASDRDADGHLVDVGGRASLRGGARRRTSSAARRSTRRPSRSRAPGSSRSVRHHRRRGDGLGGSRRAVPGDLHDGGTHPTGRTGGRRRPRRHRHELTGTEPRRHERDARRVHRPRPFGGSISTEPPGRRPYEFAVSSRYSSKRLTASSLACPCWTSALSSSWPTGRAGGSRSRRTRAATRAGDAGGTGWASCPLTACTP